MSEAPPTVTVMTSELPESGMATGNDETGPGGGKSDAPLQPAERALLDELSQPAPHVVDAVEDSPTAEAAVADDTTLPADEGGSPPDPRSAG